MNRDFYWVTDETRQFMEKGYLDAGQSVEDRVKEIADHAERILEDTMHDRDWETVKISVH